MQETTKNAIKIFLAVLALFGGVALLTMATLLGEIISSIILPIIILSMLAIVLFWMLFPKPLIVIS